MAKCKECDGTGEKFILPRGNPFHMKLPALARAMVKVRCFQCSSTGEVNAHELDDGVPALWPLGSDQGGSPPQSKRHPLRQLSRL